MHYGYNLKLSSTLKTKQNKTKPASQPWDCYTVSEDISTCLFMLAAEGQKEAGDECGCVPIYVLMRTTDVCTSRGYTIGMHC